MNVCRRSDLRSCEKTATMPALFFRKLCLFFIAAVLPVFSLGACTFSLSGTGQATVAPPATITREVTRLVTRDVTREVTRLVLVPVTVAPTETPVFTFTPSSPLSETSAPEHPVGRVLNYTDCLYGPADFFLYKTSFPAGQLVEAVGRNPDGTWINVEEVQGWDPCWIPVTRAAITGEDVESLPVVYPDLPISYWYKPPSPSAHREGDEVTVTWKAVGMAEYDYRGYLILAWVCQGGVHVFLPVNIAPPYAENTGMLSAKIMDGPGCRESSSATIYTAEKRGYFGEKIFWPPY